MDLKEIIKEQREELEEIEQQEKLVPREGFERAKKALTFPNILVITGIRRCGKSIFAYLLSKGMSAGYINFDDERIANLKTEDLNLVMTTFYELYGDVQYVVLDEIQNVDKWELFANRLRRSKKVILTGSNSNLLSGELSTHLTGRYLDIKLFPFSFNEFLVKKGFQISSAYTSKEKAEILRLLREYLDNGGFPEIHKFGSEVVLRVYNDIITKDILLRHGIRKIEKLKMLAKYLITNSSQEFTYSKLAEVLDIKQIPTISNWVSYLENSFLLFKLERFDFKLKKQFLSPKKIYCIDPGIIHSIGFKFSENSGRLMENLVAIELQRKKQALYKLEVYYWKNHQQNEVDFVLKEGKSVTQLIQVTYANSKEEIKERELNSLVKAGKALRCKKLIVITWNYESSEKGITFIPLWKWLMGYK